MNERILIVEDEAVVAAELESLLARLGYGILAIADTGAEALALASQADLVLMDIRIFGPIDGVQTADLIRQQFGKPVVFLTSHADTHTLARAGSTEPFGYIVKPFDEQDLQATLEIALHRSRAEARIRKMERWLTTTLNSIADAVITADLDGRVTYMNPMAELLTGCHARPSCGLPFESVFKAFHGADRAPVANPIARVIQEGIAISPRENTFLLASDGVERPIEDSAAPVRDEFGHITGGVLIFRDCSRRLEAEAIRKRMEERMQQAQKFESLGLIAGGVAHDFNNILTAIIGHTELLKQKLADADGQASARHILEASMRASALCKQMISYAGKGPADAGPVDVNRVIAETAGLVRASLKKETALAVATDVDLPAAHADAGQLQQVILNLLLNAAEAIADGGGEIRVHSYPLPANSAYLETAFVSPDSAIERFICIEIADTGCGIPPETLAKIFDPFFSTKFAGRGLGLASALGIVRRHRGTIHVESQPGRGSTFRILLPESSVQIPRETASMGFEGSTWRGFGTILLVDDDSFVRVVTKETLNRFGFTVISLEDGRVALNVFQQRQSEIVACVLDLNLPACGGLEILRELRKTSNVPALLIGGHVDEAAATILASLAPCAHLPKPFTGSNVQEALRRLVQIG